MTKRMEFGRTECLERATRLESWAMGVMEQVPTSEGAERILSNISPAWGPLTMIDATMVLEMKHFLSLKVRDGHSLRQPQTLALSSTTTAPWPDRLSHC